MTADRITLYELAGRDSNLRFSPHCWKVRMALAHKALEADRRPWRFTEKQIIAFTGQELVPVLVDGNTAISDSWRIALHLEDRFPDRPSLFGNGAAIPLARFINGWADTVLLPAIARLILTDVHDCLDAADRPYFRTSRERRFGQTLEQVVADRPAHFSALRQALAPLRQTLKGQEFISGSAAAYSDYCVFGMFMWARCTSNLDLAGGDDGILAWQERLLDAFGGMARAAPMVHARVDR